MKLQKQKWNAISWMLRSSNCETVVHNGPQMNGYSQCSDYIDPFETYSAARSVHNVQFYSEDTCDCYTTAGGGYWTS